MGDVYNNINDDNPKRKGKILIVLDGIIADIMTNKQFQAIIKDLLFRCRKLNISLVLLHSLTLVFQKKSCQIIHIT